MSLDKYVVVAQAEAAHHEEKQDEDEITDEERARVASAISKWAMHSEGIADATSSEHFIPCPFARTFNGTTYEDGDEVRIQIQYPETGEYYKVGATIPGVRFDNTRTLYYTARVRCINDAWGFDMIRSEPTTLASVDLSKQRITKIYIVRKNSTSLP